MGVKYVKEFTFPASGGFHVQRYAKGGHVTKMPSKAKPSAKGMPKRAKHADGGPIQRKMIDNPQPTNDLEGIVLQPGQSYTSIATPMQREAPSPFAMPSAARSADDVYRELKSNPANRNLPDEILRQASQNRASSLQSQYDKDMAFYNSPESVAARKALESGPLQEISLQEISRKKIMPEPVNEVLLPMPVNEVLSEYKPQYKGPSGESSPVTPVWKKLGMTQSEYERQALPPQPDLVHPLPTDDVPVKRPGGPIPGQGQFGPLEALSLLSSVAMQPDESPNFGREALDRRGLSSTSARKPTVVLPSKTDRMARRRAKTSNRGEMYAKGGEVKGEKISKVMREYKEGKLRSGSKKGPKVTNPKQAMAIALSEARSKKADGGNIKKAVHKHEKAMHPGKPMTKLQRGGVPTYGRKAMYGSEEC